MRQWITLIETAGNDETGPQMPQTDPTQTPAFKRWFGASKVVDAQGRPLRCYHGTTAAFDRFSDEDIPDRGGLLAFFSTDPEFAGNYAGGHLVMAPGEPSPGANIMPVYLRIENPFDFRTDWRTAHEFWEETGGIRDQYEANRILMGLGHDLPEGIFTRNAPDLTEEDFVGAVKAGSWDALEAPEFVRYLHSVCGCDGVVLLELGAVNYGIFDANQVKSAISNSGDYDDDSDQIDESHPRRA